MTERDLGTLATFRQWLPEPDEATARRVYERATAARLRHVPQWTPVWRGRGRRPLALALTAAVLVIAPPAVAFGGRIIDFFEGTAPTPAVVASFAPLADAPSAATRKGASNHLPGADVSKLHGVIEIHTADGPEDLWAAPNGTGGQCVFVDFANDSPVQGAQPGNGTCDASMPPVSRMTLASFWMRSHSSLSTVYGRVYANAASVKLGFADGSSQTVQVIEGHYLASIPNDSVDNANVIRATALDAQGDQVAAWAPPS